MQHSTPNPHENPSGPESSEPLTEKGPPLWPVFLTVFGVILSALFVAAALIVAAAFQAGGLEALTDPKQVEALTQRPILTIITCAVTAIFMGLGAWVLKRPTELPSVVAPKMAEVIVAVLAVLALSNVLELALLRSGLFSVDGTVAILEEMFRSSTGLEFVGLLLMVPLQGVVEEIFYRGAVQRRLRARWGAWPSIFMAALLFGLMHMDRGHSLFAFAMGLLLGWIYERTGKLRLVAWGHGVNNFLAVMGARYSEDGHSLLLSAVALVGLVCSVAYLGRAWKPQRIDRSVGIVVPARTLSEPNPVP